MFRLRARYRLYRRNKKLRDSGYESWESYRRNNDKDIIYYANDIKSYYHGYKYIIAIDDHHHYAYKIVDRPKNQMAVYGYEKMFDYCNKNMRFKYRADIHRVLRLNEDYHMNDIGGYDVFFFAFMDSRDVALFTLRFM